MNMDSSYSSNRVLIWGWLIAGLVQMSSNQYTSGQHMNTSGDRILVNTNWTYRSQDGKYSGIARIPGSIHVDLLLNQQIPDPYYRDEASDLGWIDTTTWIYSSWLTGLPEIPISKQVDLVFEGLDTYAYVFINNDLVLEASNMFRTWKIPLTKYRHLDTVQLEVVFVSAVVRGQESSKAIPWTYPADSDRYPGKPSVFSRKAAYQFGWDFAPPMPGCGIWKPVYLETRSDIQLLDAWLQTTRIQDDTAEVVVQISLYSDREQAIQMQATVGKLKVVKAVEVMPGRSTHEFIFNLINAELWWPLHEGEPALVDVDVKATSPVSTHQLTWKAGVRTITLNQTPDSLGTPFTFVVNGRPVFAVGANWVPADMFPGRIPVETYRDLLQSAHDAGFTMLRVWGGGIYESDLFYHLADSLGIMIWQDFMFANTMYPGDSLFLQNVRQEVAEQMIRLRKHPSLALWCGNNEIDVAWKNWGWPSTYKWTPDAMTSMHSDYEILFGKVLPDLVDKLNKLTDYVQTSPLSNWGDPADLAHGDNHFWGVWHGEMPFDSLRTRVPRFMSEYGMQSFPAWESLQKFSKSTDWALESPVMAFHQRSYKGNGLIDKYRIMEEVPDPGNDFKAWVGIGHRLQAKAFSIGLTAHLNAQPFCMGSLLWQFNEPWPGASWSIIDYYGQKKPAYFKVKEVVSQYYGLENK